MQGSSEISTGTYPGELTGAMPAEDICSRPQEENVHETGNAAHETDNAARKTRTTQASQAAPLIAAIAGGFILTGVKFGGAMSVFGISLAAALDFPLGTAALIGAVLSAVTGGSFWNCAPHLSAMAVMVVYNLIFRRQGLYNRRLTAVVSGVICFVSLAAVNAQSGDVILFAGVMLRAVICAAAALCFFDALVIIRCGCGSADIRTVQRLTAAGAVYMMIICSLCPRSIGMLCLGRAAAGAFCMAAARKFGVRGGAVCGILSAAAFLMCDPAAGRSGAMLAFAAMISGIWSERGKYPVNMAFILTAFGISAAAGMPSGTPAFIIDMGAAAALYCIVPEKSYISRLGIMTACRSARTAQCSQELGFAENMLTEVINDVKEASGMLDRISENKSRRECEPENISRMVRSKVCAAVCAEGQCSAVIGSAPREISEGCFRAAQALLEKKGSISGKELPAGFEGCTKKNLIAGEYSTLFAVKKVQSRKRAESRRFLDNVAYELSACSGMIGDISRDMEDRAACDEAMSESARAILSRRLPGLRSVRVTYDKEGHAFCEAFFTADGKFTDIKLLRATEKLSELLGEDMEQPAMLCCSPSSQAADTTCEGEKLFRARWWCKGEYYPDFSVACRSARGGVCGDSSAAFEDGRGNFYLILSDGMGTGERAAAQSSMAVSVLRRLILAGAGCANAVRMLDVILCASGADEVFTTVDLLSVSCFDGRARLIKMGAAPTVLRTDEQEYSFDDTSAPVGIIGGMEVRETAFDLDNSSRLLMMTDGVNENCRSFITALLENERLTCEQTADKLADYAVSENENSRTSLPDDVTVAAVRLISN